MYTLNLSEEDIRKIALQAINELGENANPAIVKQVVEEALSNSEITKTPVSPSKSSGKVILTSFGLNHPGIIAGVTRTLSESNCDITDLSQKLMGDFYTMIIILDITKSSKDLTELQNDLNKIADELKIKVYLQHEDLFRQMHRV